MKNRILALTFIFFVTLSTSYAAKFNVNDYIKVGQSGKIDLAPETITKSLTDALESAQENMTKKLDKEVEKLQDSLESHVTKVTDKIDAEIQKTSDKINNGIIGKAEKMIDRAESEFDNLIAMKNKIGHYILIAKIVVGLLISGLFLMVFFFWRSYSNLKKLAKNIKDMTGLDEVKNINKRLDELDKKIDKLLKSSN